jgi:hypothetical protein
MKADFNTVSDACIDVFQNEQTKKQAIMLKGPPGTGKSAMAQYIADTLGAELTMMHPPRMNPVNLMGYPMQENKIMEWAEPAVMHKLSTGRHVLLIEEVTQAGPTMQAAVAGLCHDRGINEIKLSDDVFVILTGNDTDDGAGAKPLMTHLGDRLIIMGVQGNEAVFSEHMLDKHFSGPEPTCDVTGLAFLKLAPQHLYDWDSNREINATMRSWELALTINYNVPKHRLMLVLMGILPEGIVHEYLGFREVADRLPDVSQIKADPLGVPMPNDPDVRHVLAAHMITNTNDLTTYSQYMPFVGRLPPELQTFYNHAVVKKLGAVVSSSAPYTSWVAASAKARGSH